MEYQEFLLGDCLSMIVNGAVISQKDGAKGLPITRIETLSRNRFNRDRLGYADIQDDGSYANFILDNKDLLMSHINSREYIGRTVQYIKEGSEKIIHGMNLLRIKTKEDILDSTFAYYLFQTAWFKRNIDCIRKDAINQSSISVSDIKRIKLYLPSIEIQREIAKKLSYIDDKISLNRKMNSTLEAMAKQLYDYWFVQFDFPNEEGKPYKSSGGKMVYNEKLKREIPEGWEVGNILDISKLITGGTPSKSVPEYWNNGDIPFFGPTDCEGSIFQYKTEYKITKEGVKHSAAKIMGENCVIITARGSIGKFVITAIPMAMNQSCFAFESKQSHYEHLFFLVEQLIQHLLVKGSGSTFKSIVGVDIENSILCLGDDNIRSKYSRIANPLFEKIKKNTQEIIELTSLRDYLLPLLMNGQVTIKE